MTFAGTCDVRYFFKTCVNTRYRSTLLNYRAIGVGGIM